MELITITINKNVKTRAKIKHATENIRNLSYSIDGIKSYCLGHRKELGSNFKPLMEKLDELDVEADDAREALEF